MPAYRSRTSTHGRNTAGARGLWRATGMKDVDFGKPIIAIVNSFTQFVPGHVRPKNLGHLVVHEGEKAVVAHCPVFGSRSQIVRSSRSTVLISFFQGVPRNHALTGNTVNSRVSQRLRPLALLAQPLGLRPLVALSSSLRRRVGCGARIVDNCESSFSAKIDFLARRIGEAR